jgi:hypothetical protein
MRMERRTRKFALTTHITSSVGWIGAVATFLVLAAIALASSDDELVRGAYVAMEATGWYVIVPFALVSLLTGLIQALGTEWGLFRHYWVVIKLVLTIAATIVLLVHMQPIGQLADAAAQTPPALDHLHGARIQVVADAGAALAVLVIATALAVYKPRGLTPFRRRRR